MIWHCHCLFLYVDHNFEHHPQIISVSSAQFSRQALLQISSCRTPAELLAAVQAHCDVIQPEHLSAIVSRLAAIAPLGSSWQHVPHDVKEVVTAIETLLGVCGHETLSMGEAASMLCTLSRLGAPSDSALMQAAAKTLLTCSSSSSSSTSSSSSKASGTRGGAPGAPGLGQLPAELVSELYGVLASMHGLRGLPRLWRMCREAALYDPSRFSASQLAAMVRAHGVRRKRNVELLQAACTRLTQSPGMNTACARHACMAYLWPTCECITATAAVWRTSCEMIPCNFQVV